MKKLLLLFIFSISIGFINAKEETLTKENSLTNTTEVSAVFRTNVKVINRDIDERIYFYTNGTFKIIPSSGIPVKGTYSIEDRTNILMKFDNGAPDMYLTVKLNGYSVKSIKYRDILYIPF